jgi:hypothetical protein
MHAFDHRVGREHSRPWQCDGSAIVANAEQYARVRGKPLTESAQEGEFSEITQLHGG